MAYVADTGTTDPNAPPTGQPQANAPQNLPPAPVTATGAPGTSGTNVGGPGQGVTAQPNAGHQPPVQNLQDYLAANQDQSIAMGNKIASGLTAGANKVTGDIGADLSAVDAQVQASNVNPNPDLVSTAAKDPASFVTNPQNLTDFLAQENAKYTGPSSVESLPEWQTLQNEVTQATKNAPSYNLSRPNDFLTLAAGQETNPTPGMTNLDASLLMETPEAAAPIISAAAPYQALQGQFDAAGKAENGAIEAAKANDASAAGLISPAFLTGPTAKVPAWEKALQDEVTAAQGKGDAFNATIPGYQQELNLINQLMGKWGGSSSSGRNFGWNWDAPANPASGVSAPAAVGPATSATAATPDDYATEAALEQLLGGNFTGAPITQATKGQAGSYTVPGAIDEKSIAQKAYDDFINAQISTSNRAFKDVQRTFGGDSAAINDAIGAWNLLNSQMNAADVSNYSALQPYGVTR